MKHILDIVGDALPELLPGRTDSYISVTWSTDDPATLLRLADEHPHGRLEPGEYVAWTDHGRMLSVQVSYCSDDDDGNDAREHEPDPSATQGRRA